MDGLVSSNVNQDRRNELMNISVANFICLALTLQHDDVSVTAISSRAICLLEELVSYSKFIKFNNIYCKVNIVLILYTTYKS